MWCSLAGALRGLLGEAQWGVTLSPARWAPGGPYVQALGLGSSCRLHRAPFAAPWAPGSVQDRLGLTTLHKFRSVLG